MMVDLVQLKIESPSYCCNEVTFIAGLDLIVTFTLMEGDGTMSIIESTTSDLSAGSKC